MNLKSRMFWKKFNACTLAAAGIMAVTPAFGGQPVLMGPPPAPVQTPAMQEDATNNELNAFVPSYDNRDNSLPQPFKLGGVTVRPHAYYHFIYATGLQSSTNNAARSIINEFSPGVAIDLGRHWTVDYTPTLRYYDNKAFRNSVDHSATLTGNVRYEDWVFSLSQTYNKSDSTLSETATQTPEESYNTVITASVQLNDKMYAETDLSQQFNFVTGQQDSRQWSGTEWLNYVFSKRLTAGVGVGGGYVAIQPDGGGAGGNPDQSFESMQARVQWRATDKISLSVNAGFEDRQILATGYKSELNPTFGASVQYQPFDHTQFTLSGSRTISSSDYSILAQSTETTTVEMDVNQRLLEDFNLSAGVGYTKTDYTVALGAVSGVRSDDNYNFNLRLGHSFLKRGNAAVTYQYGYQRSNLAGFTYHTSQIGFEIGFAY